jgi:hypothetical protein
VLVVVDKERSRSAALIADPPKRPPARPPVRSVADKPTRLWAVATVLTLLTSGVAMSRIAGLDFTVGLGFGGPKQPKPVVLERQLPYGKGMWIWQVTKTEAGDVKAIVAKAKSTGLTHVYVRMGSTREGFYAGPFLDQILPVAHAAGIRVYGWDFPVLANPEEDVARALAAINYETPSKHRIDGFAPDIETRSEGTLISAEAATAYGDGLRAGVGDGYPLIAVVPRPSSWTKTFYPYAEVVARFDAVAPMVYWLNRYPGPDVEGAFTDLVPLGKPIFPIGQAYDGAPEGGRPGVPPREELLTFAEVAKTQGAHGISFWSWQAANEEAWEAIKDAPSFKKPPTPPPTTASPAVLAAPQAPKVLEAG